MNVALNAESRVDREFRYRQWVIRTVGEMIASVPDPILQSDELRLRVFQRLPFLAGKGKPLRGLGPSAVRKWRAFPLSDLLSMCYAMKLSPLELVLKLNAEEMHLP
jgi:hypothetical protein